MLTCHMVRAKHTLNLFSGRLLGPGEPTDVDQAECSGVDRVSRGGEQV